MSKWTHNICGDCWNKNNPEEQIASESLGNGIEDICCFCGKENSDGIYLRADPSVTRCNGLHGINRAI